MMQQIFEIAAEWARKRNEIALTVPYVSQHGPGSDDWFHDSGAACAVMVAKWSNPPRHAELLTNDVMRWFSRKQHAQDKPLAPIEVLAYLRHIGVPCHMVNEIGTKRIRSLVVCGVPVIALVGYALLPTRSRTIIGNHYIVVSGIHEDGRLLYHDPMWKDDLGAYIPITDEQLSLAMRSTNEIVKSQAIVIDSSLETKNAA